MSGDDVCNHMVESGKRCLECEREETQKSIIRDKLKYKQGYQKGYRQALKDRERFKDSLLDDVKNYKDTCKKQEKTIQDIRELTLSTLDDRNIVNAINQRCDEYNKT